MNLDDIEEEFRSSIIDAKNEKISREELLDQLDFILDEIRELRLIEDDREWDDDGNEEEIRSKIEEEILEDSLHKQMDQAVTCAVVGHNFVATPDKGNSECFRCGRIGL